MFRVFRNRMAATCAPSWVTGRSPASVVRLAAVVLFVATLPLPLPAADTPVFETDVLPIFTRYCFNCHGKSSPQLGLDLRSARLAMRGSQNGPVIVPGSLENSLLWKKVSTRQMPLALFKLKLTDAEIDTVRRWIEGGALSQPAELPAAVQAQFRHFETDIRPLLTRRCVSCHGADDPEADLDLRSLESLVRGSRTGPVIFEGFSDKSILIRKIASGLMPPPDSADPVTPGELRALKRWIDRGRFVDFVDVEPRRRKSDSLPDAAVTDADRKFWAFQKPVAVPPPQVQSADRIRTPVDRFILHRLEAAGLSFSADASPRTLLRRACFDLTGLPPTPEQTREFLSDHRPDAYGHLIDRLLASPHYGERWGRYWLDAVGYVDTADKDHNPNAPTLSEGYWRYRDYVIAATNRDTPWNRFLTEQIAGDELVDWRTADSYSPEVLEQLIATGFLRNVLDATNEDISNLPFDRYEALFKLMERVSSSTLGLTLACARCHSHKFDPIPQTDYYRFLSLFTAAYNPADWLPPKQRHLYSVSRSRQADIERRQKATRSSRDSQQQQLAALREGYRNRLRDQKLQSLPESARPAVQAAWKVEAKKRSTEQKQLLATHEKSLAVTDAQIDAALNAADRATQKDLRAQIQDAGKVLGSLKLEKVQALWDVGPAPRIRLLHRGDVDFAGPEVSPGFLSVLSAPGRSDAVPSPDAAGETSGLRLAFAEWLTAADHPLTTRVIVNRLWQHHFGLGLVATPDNFGTTGSPPSHPQLLDWLAVEFQRRGWSAKRLHKLIMMSTVYRQVSTRTAAAHRIDPENRLLGRMNLRRLDAESLRDTVITLSGQATGVIGGPPVMLKATPGGLQTIPSQTRRSVYLLARRSNPATFMRVFDYPVIDVNCTRRSSSATPLQSLTMINSEFLLDSARRVALRVQAQAGPQATLQTRIATAYSIAFQRQPSQQEAEAAAGYLQHLTQLYVSGGSSAGQAADQSLIQCVHMLICSNEFLYVD